MDRSQTIDKVEQDPEPQSLERQVWITLVGLLFFIGMMATGYYYNLTFIQFGLLDSGTRLIGMSKQAVAIYMAALAQFTNLGTLELL